MRVFHVTILEPIGVAVASYGALGHVPPPDFQLFHFGATLEPHEATNCDIELLVVSSPSLHELMSTDIRSFHVHFSIGTLSAEVCLKYSLSASESADLVD